MPSLTGEAGPWHDEAATESLCRFQAMAEVYCAYLSARFTVSSP